MCVRVCVYMRVCVCVYACVRLFSRAYTCVICEKVSDTHSDVRLLYMNIVNYR